MNAAGITLALLCALATNVAFLCKHRGAVAAPAVSARHPLRSLRGLFASRWWSIGFAVGFGAWGLHVAALALAPLSLVQAVIAGGLVLLAIPARRWFGITLGTREWTGLLLSAAGLAFLVATASEAGSGSSYSASAMTAFEGAALGIGAVLLLSGRGTGTTAGSGSILGLAAGLLFGVSDVAVKALSDVALADPAALFSPWTAVACLASVGALYAIARALQLGGPIATIAVSSIAANVAAIAGGIVVFGDPLGGDALAIIARAAALATVVIAAGVVQGRQTGVRLPATA